METSSHGLYAIFFSLPLTARLPVVVWALAAILDSEEKDLSQGENVGKWRGLAPGAYLRWSFQESGLQIPESGVTRKQMCCFFQLWSHIACQPHSSRSSCVLELGADGIKEWRENLRSLLLVEPQLSYPLQELLPATFRRTSGSDHPRSSSLDWAVPCQQACLVLLNSYPLLHSLAYPQSTVLERN